MSAINDGGPVHPGTEANGLNSGWSGMSLRDHFAGLAMPMVAQEFYRHGQVLTSGTVPQLCAKAAYEFADAMLKAREQKGP